MSLPAGRAQSAQTAGSKIALRFQHLSVCLFACLCVHTYHVRNITSYVTMQLQSTSSFWKFVGQATASESSFVLSRRRKSAVIILSSQLTVANRRRTTKLSSQHFCCTAFGYLSG